MSGLELTRADFQTDQEVRWCPGCGDYTILKAVQEFFAELGLPRHEIAFVSGIGCAARFPYYMETFGMHSIHGRAPALATGLAIARPDLSVWVVGGDGDLLSIGGNHLIHALRRNVNIKILLFNNQIYGLTKGQYSPTSETGKVTKTSPMGSIDYPFNPAALALGAEATFVARVVDSDVAGMKEIFKRAYEHKGSAFVEIFQNCNVFNDKAFIQLTGKTERKVNQVNLVAGEPVLFGGDSGKESGVIMLEGKAYIVDMATTNIGAIHVHNPSDPDSGAAYLLSRLTHGPNGPTALGILRDAERPVYEDVLMDQIVAAREARPADLSALLESRGTWDVEDSDKK